MGTRHPNYRRVKVHLTYTIEDLSRLFALHKNTVRAGRRPDSSRWMPDAPFCSRGGTVAAFLQQRREKVKQPCGTRPALLRFHAERLSVRPAAWWITSPRRWRAGCFAAFARNANGTCLSAGQSRADRRRRRWPRRSVPEGRATHREWRNLPVNCDLDNGDAQP